MTRVPIALSLAAMLALASPAHAQTSAEDRAAADALYEESGVLIKSNRFAEACPKLETSQRLDPGIGTLLRLGYCYERVGRTASAWSAYNDAEARARLSTDKRADEAAARAKAVEPKLSRLLITLASPAPGEEVRRDSKLVDAGLWGTAVPVDPGEHVIEATAPGTQPWKTTARVDATPSTTTIAIPMLVASAATPTPTPTEQAAPPYWNGQRVGGVVVGVIGVVGVVVGSVFGAKTFSNNTASMPYCPTVPTMCYAQGVALRDDAYSAATVSTVAFIAGGVALASGAITFFTATKDAPKRAALNLAPSVGPGGATLTMRGAW